MKRFAIPLLAVACLLTSCASSPAALSSEEYYKLVRENTILTDSTDGELGSYAVEVCAVLRAGDVDSSWVLGVKHLTDAGMTGQEAGGFLVYAASYACPEMLDRFPSS